MIFSYFNEISFKPMEWSRSSFDCLVTYIIVLYGSCLAVCGCHNAKMCVIGQKGTSSLGSEIISMLLFSDNPQRFPNLFTLPLNTATIYGTDLFCPSHTPSEWLKIIFFEVTQNRFYKLIMLLKVYMPSN